MLIDTVFLENGDVTVALLTPLHPLLLWHYNEYTHVIEDRRFSWSRGTGRSCAASSPRAVYRSSLRP